MPTIALEGLLIYAHHGYYKEEQIIGNDYQIDIYAEVDHIQATETDLLTDTINYETLFRICKSEMSKNSMLLEHVAQRIVNKIKSIYTNTSSVRIRISKLNPPLGVSCARSFIEIEEKYKVECNKCRSTFLSHEKGDCWTKHGKILPEIKNSLTRSFGQLICRNCLAPHLIQKEEIEDEE